jgi:hypothetical protein
VLAAVLATLAREGADCAACVQNDRDPLRWRAYLDVYEVVGIVVDIPVEPRRLDPDPVLIETADDPREERPA